MTLIITKKVLTKKHLECFLYQWDMLVDDVDHHKEGFNKKHPECFLNQFTLAGSLLIISNESYCALVVSLPNKVWMYFRETLQRLLGTRSTTQINIDIQHLCTTAFWFFIESTFIVTFMTKFNASLLMPICHGMSTKLLCYCPKIQLGQNDLA